MPAWCADFGGKVRVEHQWAARRVCFSQRKLSTSMMWSSRARCSGHEVTTQAPNRFTWQGWSCESKQRGDKYWKADPPGSVIQFEVAGQAILLMDWHFRGPMGQASVRVDDQPPVLREGWFDQTWGGYRQTTIAAPVCFSLTKPPNPAIFRQCPTYSQSESAARLWPPSAPAATGTPN